MPRTVDREVKGTSMKDRIGLVIDTDALTILLLHKHGYMKCSVEVVCGRFLVFARKSEIKVAPFLNYNSLRINEKHN